MTNTSQEKQITLDDFIRKGYFPDVLPPQFKTSKLADILSILKIEEHTTPKHSKCCIHSVPKLKVQRRAISIPNPLHQIKLCNYLETKWTELDEIYSESTISLSKPIPDPTEKRSFRRNISFREKIIKSILTSTDTRYCLLTDISRFYPTIYTHSIPWAIHGKKETKENHECDNNHYGNCIDKYIRNTHEQQTLGIPVGPDSSHIISEIIGTKIDVQLKSQLKEEKIDLIGFRCVDDMCLFFKNRHDAEKALHFLHDILHEYELEINPNKTEIIELPHQIQKEWPSEIRLYHFRVVANGNNIVKQETDLLDYFSKAFEKAIKFPNDNILKYSLKRIKEQNIFLDNWELYESLILKSIISEPMCIPVAIAILYSYKNKEYNLNNEKISRTISEMILHHSKFSHGYELAWGLYLSKALEIKISNQDAINSLSKCNDVFVALTTLDLNESNLIEGDLNTDSWKDLMKKDDLYSENWLLAYEAYIKKWLPSCDGNDYIDEDPFFKILKDNKVEFYDKTTNTDDFINIINASDANY